MPVEAVTWSVTVSTSAAPVIPPPPTREHGGPAPAARRDVYEAARSAMVASPIYRRTDLAPGCRLEGPCVIAEDDTSTVVPDQFTVAVDGLGYLHLLNQALQR
jgi:N-methylhydantoinase A